MPIKIKNREPMSGEELEASLDVPESDRKTFEKDPEAYIRAAFEAAGQKVNGVTISHDMRESMFRNIGAKPMEIVTVHIHSPKSQSFSRHIVIQI